MNIITVMTAIAILSANVHHPYNNETYNCKNFTADGIIMLDVFDIEAQPYCYQYSATSKHAIVNITGTLIDPQTLKIIQPTSPSRCSKKLMGMLS
jgi:purine nucleoside permease